MQFFLDTEFIEQGPLNPIELISIGLVADDGREYYAQALTHRAGAGNQGLYSNPNDFVARYVFPNLQHFDMGFRGRACEPRGIHCSISTRIDPSKATCPWRTRTAIKEELLAFCNPEKYGKLEFWAYYGDYDWVIFSQIFGTMIDLPKGWPMYCHEIKQLCDELGNPDLSHLEGKNEHNALADARWNAEAYRYLRAYAQT